MEENNYKHYPHYHAWKWVVGILIVLAAFGAGFLCGRFSVFFGGYGYPMGPWMMGGYGYPAYYYGPAGQQAAPPENATTSPAPYYYPMYRMMGGYYGYPSQATSTQ